jgi:hypothetical protein
MLPLVAFAYYSTMLLRRNRSTTPSQRERAGSLLKFHTSQRNKIKIVCLVLDFNDTYMKRASIQAYESKYVHVYQLARLTSSV